MALAAAGPLVFSDAVFAALFSLAFFAWIAGELRWLWLRRAHGDRRAHGQALSVIVFCWLGLWLAALCAERFAALSLAPSRVFALVGLVAVCAGLVGRRSAERAFAALSYSARAGRAPGPYRYIRHPGFAASLVTMLGFGLLLSNWASLCLCVLVPLVGYLHRISVEESALAALFGRDYGRYARETARLLPGVW